MSRVDSGVWSQAGTAEIKQTFALSWGPVYQNRQTTAALGAC